MAISRESEDEPECREVLYEWGGHVIKDTGDSIKGLPLAKLGTIQALK